MRPALIALALLPCLPAAAQVVTDCEPTLAQARSIAEPWEANTVTLAGGEVRLAVIDAIEPGAVPFHLMILTPPYDEHGARWCWIVSQTDDRFGFSALTLEAMDHLIAADGQISVTLRAGLWNDSTGQPDPVLLGVIIDPATGEVTAKVP